MAYYIGKRDREKLRQSRFVIFWAKKLRAVSIKGGKCVSCGECRPWVMQFHHLGRKEAPLAKLLHCNWSRIHEEIKRCDLLCERCHREIHASINAKDRSIFNKGLCLSLKGVFSCEKCGYNKCNKALDFHHEDDKLTEISDLVTHGKWNTVQDVEDSVVAELQKCRVLCANCHRDEHFDKQKLESLLSLIEQKSNALPKAKKPVDRGLVLELRRDGLSQAEIAAKMKCGVSTVCSILKESGIHSYSPTIDPETVRKLLQEGKTSSQICKILGCHWMTMRKFLPQGLGQTSTQGCGSPMAMCM